MDKQELDTLFRLLVHFKQEEMECGHKNKKIPRAAALCSTCKYKRQYRNCTLIALIDDVAERKEGRCDEVGDIQNPRQVAVSCGHGCTG